MAERQLPKLNVAGSIPVSRSTFSRSPFAFPSRLLPTSVRPYWFSWIFTTM